MTPYADLLAASLEPQVQPGSDDARAQLARLYRDIGISAVAAALHATNLASVEEREAVKRASQEIPPMLRKTNLAA